MRTVTRVLIAAALAFGLGCAQKDWIDRTLVTVDVTGTWQSPSAWATLNLEQQGSKVTGSIRFTGGANLWGLTGGPIEGSVAGDVFRFRDKRGNLEGEMTISGDEMNGVVTSSQSNRRWLPLQRVDSPTRPASPPR